MFSSIQKYSFGSSNRALLYVSKSRSKTRWSSIFFLQWGPLNFRTTCLGKYDDLTATFLKTQHKSRFTNLDCNENVLLPYAWTLPVWCLQAQYGVKMWLSRLYLQPGPYFTSLPIMMIKHKSRVQNNFSSPLMGLTGGKLVLFLWVTDLVKTS